MTRLTPLARPRDPDNILSDPDIALGDLLEGADLESSRRPDGWTAERQRRFCDLVATGQTVEGAARACGLTAASAYSFRHSAKGAGFGVGWAAAQLMQRHRLADMLAARAFDGQTVTITRPDGSTHQRHHHDNRLALAMLTRLDRIAAGRESAGPEAEAARIAAGEWTRFLDVLGEGGGPARAGLFLAQRTLGDAAVGAPELAAIAALARADLYDRTGAGVPAELDVADLDPADRARWTAADWARAEAAGLVALAPGVLRCSSQLSQDNDPAPAAPGAPAAPDPAADEFDDPVWYDDAAGEWRTVFPPPADFDGEEWGAYGSRDYERSLSTEERLVMLDVELADADAAQIEHADAARARDAWFAETAETTAAIDADTKANRNAGCTAIDHDMPPTVIDHDPPPTARVDDSPRVALGHDPLSAAPAPAEARLVQAWPASAPPGEQGCAVTPADAPDTGGGGGPAACRL